MFVPCPSRRQLTRTLAICTAAAGLGSVLAGGAGAAAGGPWVHTDRGCYLLGQRVLISGDGFGAGREFDVAIDGIDFGQSTTDSAGEFSSSLIPGGLAAGQLQQVDHLDATDGARTAETEFTMTRRVGGRLQASSGNPHTLRAPFQVWGFAPDGRRRTVYLHYIRPSGRSRSTVAVGKTGGQCGYLRTRSRRVFPFLPSLGKWTLQLDTSRSYQRIPDGPVARIRGADSVGTEPRRAQAG